MSLFTFHPTRLSSLNQVSSPTLLPSLHCRMRPTSSARDARSERDEVAMRNEVSASRERERGDRFVDPMSVKTGGSLNEGETHMPCEARSSSAARTKLVQEEEAERTNL